jgi:hypothetical protein
MKYSSIIILMLASCTPDNSEIVQTVEPVDDVEEEVVETPPVPENTSPCAEDEEAEGVRFQGSIAYPDGTIGDGSNTRIHMCQGGCLTAVWDDGDFCYPEGRLNSGVYLFKVIPLGTEDHATPLSFVTIGEEDVVLDKPVMVPEFSNVEDVVDGIFEAGNGLEIHIVSDSYSSMLGPDGYVAAVDVDPEEAGLPLNDLNTEKIVGMWYLGSYDADIEPIWSFQVHDTGLAVGTKVKILNSSYYDRKWLDVGTATVGEDGVLYTDDDSGISILSTLILLKE